MNIKETYKTLLADRYKNKKYYNQRIEFEYDTNIIRIASPNCSTRLVLKPIYTNSLLTNLEYALSGDMFAFVVTELLIDCLLTNTKESSKQYLYNLNNRISTNTELDLILNSNYKSASIGKILGYFTSFINSYLI